MNCDIYYKKNKNKQLFTDFQNKNYTDIENVQNYIPIYNNFFSLNSTNYNGINLNHKFALSSIVEKKTNHIFVCKVKDEHDNYQVKDVFFKFSPILDPLKYMIGKYQKQGYTFDLLPKLEELYNSDGNNEKPHPKVFDVNNSAYTDSFFSYLTSQLLHNNNFIHGLDFYGSFLGIKNNFSVNVCDDLEYLADSEFFNTNHHNLFQLNEIYDENFLNGLSKKNKKKIKIDSKKSNISVDSFQSFNKNIEEIFSDEHTASEDKIQEKNSNENNDEDFSSEVTELTSENLNFFLLNNENKINHKKDIGSSLKSDSTSCSSRTSNTEDHEEGCEDEGGEDESGEDGVEDESDEDESDEDESDEDESGEDGEEGGDDGEEGGDDGEEGGEEDESEEDGEDESSDEESEEGFSSESESESFVEAVVKKFPVQLICLEKCDNTLDSLMCNDNTKKEDWVSAFMQIIMTLITYQKCFDLTHNDLHTNNIMYQETKEEFIYYKYDSSYYKVPTYNKLYKIIDFGRAIYSYKGKVMCSDSFHPKGDASSQYNCEPYFNNKKPRLDPNMSFDLCRLGCALFDYFVDDIDTVNEECEADELVKLVVSWCKDDKNRNILYKNNGEERYPEFKLYKMIARTVHGCVPYKQLENPLFQQFKISKKELKRESNDNIKIINIDDIGVYT